MKPRDLKPTSARPITIDGVTFRCYHTGINRYSWFSDDGKLSAGRRYPRMTYWAQVGEGMLTPRFRSAEGAMAAAVKAARAND